MRADLHIHSTASDGRLSPAQLKAQGLELGLDYMALTDHDTLQGLAAWPGEDPGPMLIPGVEISCALDTEIHLLAYGVSAQMTPLADFLAQMRRERAERAARMAQALRALGFRVSLERLTSPPPKALAGHTWPEFSSNQVRSPASKRLLHVIWPQAVQPMCPCPNKVHPRCSAFCRHAARCPCWLTRGSTAFLLPGWKASLNSGSGRGSWAWRSTIVPIALSRPICVWPALLD